MFSKRIRDLREDKDLTQEQLGKNFNVAKTTVASWEQGRGTPGNETLIDIAEFFNVSTDYLLGKKEKSQDEKLIELMQKAENNYKLKMIFDKTGDLDDKALDKLEKLIDIISEEE